MGNLVLVGLQQLRTLVGTYEQFVGYVCNVFEIFNVYSENQFKNHSIFFGIVFFQP